MKNIFTKSILVCLMMTSILACQKDNQLPSLTSEASGTDAAYLNVFEGKVDNGDGTWTYRWSMQNNTGLQNLSHWAMDLGTCVTINDVVSAQQGSSLSTLSGVEVLFAPDPSFTNNEFPGCVFTNSVFKFDLGVEGSTAKSYYCITLTKNVSTTTGVTGYYKSGKITGCGSFTFTGLGCEVTSDEGTSYSQGYWFARPKTVWPIAGLTIGGENYTQAQGKAIWDASNKKGLADSKAAFTQAAAILLSGSEMVKPGATVWADVTIVQSYLSGLDKLSPKNLPTGDAVAKEAAGRISAWITAHHADTNFGN